MQNVGIMSPGQMGQALGIQLKQKGLHVLTALDERSERSKALAAAAGFEDVGTLAALAERCDVILSIMDPGAASGFATQMADAIRASGRSPLFVDCNALAPDTVKRIAEVVNGAGGRCVDAGVMGPPPTDTVTSRLFVSGPDAAALEALATPQLSVFVVSDRVGDASAIKLCDSVMSKGMTALLVQMLVVAKRLGVDRTLAEQCVGPRRYFHDWIMRTLPIVPPKAYRWVPEVKEVASMFESAGVPGAMMRDAADIYAWLAATPLGREAPEDRDASRTGEDIVALLAGLPKN